MTKRTKKSVGTRRRKNRSNYRKKTLRNKKYRNRKTRRGYRGGEGSDDEAEETKEESVSGITSGLRNLDVNGEGSSSSRDVDNITSGINNLTVAPTVEVDVCPICIEPLNDEPTFTTICNHTFHERCFSQLCDTNNVYHATKKCPNCRGEVTVECFVLKQLSEFETPKPANTYTIYRLLENLLLNEIGFKLTNINAKKIELWESRKRFLKKYIKILLTKPGLNLSMVSGLSSGRDQIQEIFTYMIDIGDDEIIDLILNKQIPGLNDNMIRALKTNVLNKDKLNEVIAKMKNPQIRQNFPNVVTFSTESANELFIRGVNSKDNAVIREALNMPDLNLHTALCLLISKYKEGDDDGEGSSQDEETKEEHIPEDSLRTFKDEIIANPEFNPFILCDNNRTMLFQAIESKDENTMYSLLNNPRLQQGLTNFMIADLKENAYRSDTAKNKALFRKIIDYITDNANKPKFESIKFSREFNNIFKGGK